jgi:isocitrate dehydrogenase
MYWAQAISQNSADPKLAARFAAVAKDLVDNESEIVAELEAVQGPAVDIGGYYNPSDELASAAMRPSATLNRIIDAI